jgi:GTP pyrophosphokinase
MNEMKKVPAIKDKTASVELEKRFESILDAARVLDGESRDLLSRAFRFAVRAHAGQYRLSGEPFIVHGIEVGKILMELGLDPPTVAAGLLHDVVEDTGIDLEELERRFGAEIAQLVQGLTELGKLAFLSPEQRQVESARRMLVSMAKDIRVIFIKLADRLHNMRTLEHLPPERMESIAKETLEVYAPLAHRMGMHRIKSELEDLAFRFIDEKQYLLVKDLVRETAEEGEAVFESFKAPIEKRLDEAGIDAKITSRIKHIFSIHKKMLLKGVQVEGIYDILSLRIITKHVRDCYHALEIVHGLFTPIHGRFKDYIAAPKSNMYQSIHTTVMDESGRKIEIQIRTEMMNSSAEHGLAAHWLYKGKGKTYAGWQRWLDWYRQTLDYQLELTDPAEFFRYLKTDLFQNEIYVFTPAGELKQLPTGSTPLDFAYAVHSDVGNHCTAAKVNGRLVSLDYALKSGDKVEIVTSPRAEPHEKWLNRVRTSRARAKIRQWFRSKNQEQEVRLGKELLRSELRRGKREIPRDEFVKRIMSEFGADSLEKLYSGIARGTISLQKVVQGLYPGAGESEIGSPEQHADALREFVKRPIKGIRIEGLGNIEVRYAKCCQPLPGDAIIGIITRGRGVSVHRVDCKNVRKMGETDRLINVEWDTQPGQHFLVSLVVTAQHRDGMVAEIKKRVRDMNTEVRAGRFEIIDGELRMMLVVGISNLDHLQKVISEIKGIKNIDSVSRAL